MDSLVGITAGDWWKLLAQNKFAIHPFYCLKAAFVTYKSIRNSLRLKQEQRSFAQKIDQVKIKKDPIFILGHWRSGTTLLQNLMLLDKQFAYPTVFQCNYPHTFLSIESKILKMYKNSDSEARPMDEVAVSPLSPGEEEFALAILTLQSPLLAWIFPRQEEYYDRYLTFQQVSKSEIEQWQSALLFYMKKLTFRNQRQLLLKSPPNTGRIKLLLELFPNAKFIHIHRNPYVVFQSTQRLYKKALPSARMQGARDKDHTPGIIKRYAMMYDAYFDERNLIPANNLIDVKFESLEKDQMGQIARIYQQLNIEGFGNLRPRLEQYIASISGYKKNKHAVIDDSVKSQLAAAWQKSFHEWGYPL